MKIKPDTKTANLLRQLTHFIIAICALVLGSPSARASIAYGSINNFDTVNDTGTETHGFEIEIEDCHSTDITYTYNYNHYGVPRIEQDDTDPAHPKCRIRWESKKNANGSWAAFTAIPAGPIAPTNGHMFTNPNVNFGGEHFGVGYRVPATKVLYHWLVDNGAGALVRGGAVQVSTPVFTYYPPVVGVAPAQVQAVIAPPPPPVPPVKEFGKAVWVKEIKTTTHNSNKIKLRELVSDDPDDANDKNWANGEPDEVEMEWRILQLKTSAADGGPNAELAAAPEDLPNGDEVVTRRYEFYKYTGPLDGESGEAMADAVDADGLHGAGMRTYNHHMVGGEWVTVTEDMATIEVVGEFTGSQMAAVDVEAAVGLIEHVSEGKVNTAYAARTLVVEGAWPFMCVRDGALPPGMEFDDVTGVLSGTPTAAGEYQFKITASDLLNPDVERNYTLRVAAVGAALAAESLVDTAASPVGTGTTSGDGSFVPGTDVTVNAVAEPGYRFVNWTDNGKVVANTESHTFAIDVNHSLIANFALSVPQWSITTSAAPAEGGTTSGDGMVDSGSNATVTATPNAGYSFTNWTESGVFVSTSASYIFTATADRALVANFSVVPTFTVTTSATPAIGGTTTGDGSFASGTSATVTATANSGYVFSKWTVGATQVSTLASYTFTVTANRALVANFIVAGTQQTITTNANPAAGGTTSGGGSYASGDSATVTATPNPYYKFTRWQEGSTTVSTSPSYTFTVAGSRTLTAKFTEAFVITTSSSPAIGGTTEMDSTDYKTGENAKASASPDAGWSFANWTENGIIVSANEDYTFNVTGNRTLVANFVADSGVTITTNSSPSIGGTTLGDGAYAEDDLVIVSAQASEGFVFEGWTVGGVVVSTDANYTFTAAANLALVATFAPPPVLATAPAAVGGNAMTLSWPATRLGWSLEESPDLVTWTPSVRAINTTAGQNTVTIPTTGGSRFFRLAHP